MWDADEEDTIPGKSQKPWYLNLRLLFFAFVLAFALLFQDRLGTTAPIDKAFAMSLSMLGVWFLVQWAESTLKNASPKLIAQGIHSTTRGHPETVGNYNLWSLGDVDAFGIHWNGSDGTLIAPIIADTKIGKSVVVRVHPIIKDKNELPWRVYQYIMKNPRFKPPYYVGRVDEEQYTLELDTSKADLPNTPRKPSVGYLINELEEDEKFINFLGTQIAGKKFASIEEAVEWAERLRPKETTSSKFGDIFRAKKEETER